MKLCVYADDVSLFTPKCEALCISNKRTPITTTYCLNNVTLRWSSLFSSIFRVHHYFQSITFQQRLPSVLITCVPLYGVLHQLLIPLLTGVLRPLLEYGCQLWNPFTNKEIQLLENIQYRAARGTQWNLSELARTKSSDICLVELRWPSL